MTGYYYVPYKNWAGISCVRLYYPDGDYLCDAHENLALNITAKDIAEKICNLLNKELENDTQPTTTL
jgi:hypothetical protein